MPPAPPSVNAWLLLTAIHDTAPASVAQRVLAMIATSAATSPNNGSPRRTIIDGAVTLGLAIRKALLFFGDALGPRTVLEHPDTLHTLYRDPRYRPQPG